MQLFFTQIDPPEHAHIAVLQEKGWQVGHLPLRQVVLHELELDLSDYDILILSSKQAARWLLRHLPPRLPKLAVVGASTSALLPRAQLLLPDPPAHAADLVALLRPQLRPQTRLLFLRGEKAMDTIPQELSGYDFHQCIVYSTQKIMENSSPPPGPAMVYFQAPGTVADYLEAFGHPPNIIGAIGPTTATALDRAGWHVDFQPSRPENACFARELPPPSIWRSTGTG